MTLQKITAVRFDASLRSQGLSFFFNDQEIRLLQSGTSNGNGLYVGHHRALTQDDLADIIRKDEFVPAALEQVKRLLYLMQEHGVDVVI